MSVIQTILVGHHLLIPLHTLSSLVKRVVVPMNGFLSIKEDKCHRSAVQVVFRRRDAYRRSTTIGRDSGWLCARTVCGTPAPRWRPRRRSAGSSARRHDNDHRHRYPMARKHGCAVTRVISWDFSWRAWCTSTPFETRIERFFVRLYDYDDVLVLPNTPGSRHCNVILGLTRI